MPNSSVSSQVDPNAIARRLMQRAHHQDGLPEIAVGVGFLLVAGLSYAQVKLAGGSMGVKAAVLALSFLILLLGFGSPWALKWVRNRYLIGRVGYVQPQPAGRKQITIGAAFAVLAAILSFGAVTRFSQPDRWILAGTGLFGGALAALCGRLPRFVIGGALMAATGICIAFSDVSLQAGFAILFGFQGILAVVSGGVVFVRMIREPIEAGE